MFQKKGPQILVNLLKKTNDKMQMGLWKIVHSHKWNLDIQKQNFFLECQLSNLKEGWNELTFVDNSNFDFSKISYLLNQKIKNYDLLEKRKTKK